MQPKAESCTSQGTFSGEKKKNNKLYYSSKKALEKAKNEVGQKTFNFRGHSKFLDFGNVDDTASITNKVLQAIQEVEEVMIIDVNEAKCAIKVNICPAPPRRNHFIDVQFHKPSFVEV